MSGAFGEWAADRKFKMLVLLVLLLVAGALVAYMYSSVRQARYAYMGPTTISVRGVGEVTRVPDIATFSFNVHTEADKPEQAQSASADATNKILDYIREQGVADTDVQTMNYYMTPQYEYQAVLCDRGYCPPGKQELSGYSVDQTISVKVRDTAQAGNLIAGVGERGATDVSGLQFTVDDDESAKAEARADAVKQAKQKAEDLADTLGVRLVRLTGFWEEEQYNPMYDKSYYGGGAMMEQSMSVPQIPTGENMITSVVNLTYEIK